MLGNSLASHSLIWFFSSRRFFPAHRMLALLWLGFLGQLYCRWKRTPDGPPFLAAGLSKLLPRRERLTPLHFLLPNFPSCSREEKA